MPGRDSPAYSWDEVGLLRASTDPGGLDLPQDLLSPDGDMAARQVRWLSQMWHRERVRTALTVASPALSRQVEAIVSAPLPDRRDVSRAALSLASYLLRWQRRATPFGLFAGVSPARIGGTAGARWHGQRTRVRADASWVGDVTARLLGCPGLLDRVPVAASNAATVRGDRLTAPGFPPDGGAQDLAPVEVSVRYSRPVRAALEAAREPVPFGKLARQVAADFPDASAERVGDLLAELVSQGFLVSDLRAPMTCTDALGYLTDRLRELQAHDIPEVSELARELTRIHGSLRAAGDMVTPAHLSVAERMRALSHAADTPLVADTVLDCDVQIPGQVAREARDAACLLSRVSPYPRGYPSWIAYHAEFLDRFGPGTAVPVLELTADSGLGFPAGYLGSAREMAPRTLARRDETLLAMIQQAMTDGTGEITLDGPAAGRLAGDEAPDAGDLPSRAEIAVEIRSASLDALNRGRFTLMVTGTPRSGSSMIGRHLYALDGQDHDLLAASFAPCQPGTVAAQLSFAPRKRRNENVARTEGMLPAVIPIAEACGSRDTVLIPIADLAVTAGEHGFSLIRLSTGKLVEPRVTHALEAGTHTPPLARFLSEISSGRCAVYKAFDFGAAARLPYLPRVRYRRTILSPARWLLAASGLPRPNVSVAEWDEALRGWQARWKVPDHVAVVDQDRRQPVDLRHPVHRAVLRTRLRRSGRVEIRETAAPEDLGWLGRAHELVIPLHATTSRQACTETACLPQTPAAAGRLPGSSGILHVRISGHPARFDEILAKHLPRLIADLGELAPTWWFSRRGHQGLPDGEQAIALFAVLPGPAAYGDAAARVSAWADGMRASRMISGLAFRTFQPGDDCPGGLSGARSGRQVLTADSAAAIAQIALSMRTGLDQRAIAAASMTSIASEIAGSRTTAMRWLVQELPRERGPLDQALREQVMRITDADGTWDHLASLPGGPAVVAAWRQRAVVLAHYRRGLDEGHAVPVLHSLLHLHHLRASGVDDAAERVANRLARACALRFLTTRQDV